MQGARGHVLEAVGSLLLTVLVNVLAHFEVFGVLVLVDHVRIMEVELVTVHFIVVLGVRDRVHILTFAPAYGANTIFLNHLEVKWLLYLKFMVLVDPLPGHLEYGVIKAERHGQLGLIKRRRYSDLVAAYKVQ